LFLVRSSLIAASLQSVDQPNRSESIKTRTAFHGLTSHNSRLERIMHFAERAVTRLLLAIPESRSDTEAPLASRRKV